MATTKPKSSVERLRGRYPIGTRVEVKETIKALNASLEAGQRGTIRCVDSKARLIVAWDSGENFPLLPSLDQYEVIGFVTPELTRESLLWDAYEFGVMRMMKKTFRKLFAHLYITPESGITEEEFEAVLDAQYKRVAEENREIYQEWVNA